MCRTLVQNLHAESGQIHTGSESTCIDNLPVRPAAEDGRRRVALSRADLTAQVIARFHQKIQKTETCWLWTGTHERTGYGQVYTHRRPDGRRVRHYAHRVAYAIAKGFAPADLEVMHSCDRAACVNPNHLILGTHHDNMLDRAAKGRAAKIKPSLRIISPEDVIAIRRNDRPAKEWADQFGVCVSHINRIRRGERRKAA